MTLPPLHLLRTFDASARAASFATASRALGISPAAVSQQIRQLELWFGRKLFLRAGRGVQLSPAGQDLHQAVAAGLGVIGRAADRLRRDPAANGLTVACIPLVAARWLIPNLAAFQALHPLAELRLLSARTSQPFASETMDALITLAEPQPHRAGSQMLFSGRRRPVASAQLAERHPHLHRAAGLATANLLHDGSPEGWAAWFARAGVTHRGPPHGPVFQDAHLLFTAVLAGQGVALCPVDVVRQEIGRGDLVVLSDIETATDQSCTITCDPNAPPRVTAFADWFRSICRADGQGGADPATARPADR